MDTPSNNVSSISLDSMVAQTAALFNERGIWAQLAAAEISMYEVINKYPSLHPPRGSGALHDEFVNGLNPVMQALAGKDAAGRLPLGTRLTLFLNCVDGKSQRARMNSSATESKMQALARGADDIKNWVDTKRDEMTIDDRSIIDASLAEYQAALAGFQRYAEQVRQYQGQGKGAPDGNLRS